MKIQELNFEDLRRETERKPDHEVPFKLIATYKPARLRTLLRHHDDGTVYGDDIDRRDAVDELLAHHSLMEVAAIARYIPAKLPSSYRESALVALTNPSVRLYYEKAYPLLLPRAHRERLRGTWTKTEKGNDAAPLFASFAELNRAIEDDDDVETFLWFLEDGFVEDSSIEDLLEIVGNPERFAEALGAGGDVVTDETQLWDAIKNDEAMKRPEELLRRFTPKEREPTPEEKALRGFRKFLFFARDLDALLQRCATYPLLQSAMWHYHAYWFDELSDELRPYMAAAIDRFAQWDVAPAEMHEWMEARSTLIADTRADRLAGAAELHAAISRLTSGVYGKELRARFDASQKEAAPRRAEVRAMPAGVIVRRTPAHAPSARAAARSNPSAAAGAKSAKSTLKARATTGRAAAKHTTRPTAKKAPSKIGAARATARTGGKKLSAPARKNMPAKKSRSRAGKKGTAKSYRR